MIVADIRRNFKIEFPLLCWIYNNKVFEYSKVFKLGTSIRSHGFYISVWHMLDDLKNGSNLLLFLGLKLYRKTSNLILTFWWLSLTVLKDWIGTIFLLFQWKFAGLLKDSLHLRKVTRIYKKKYIYYTFLRYISCRPTKRLLSDDFYNFHDVGTLMIINYVYPPCVVLVK